MLFSIGMGLLKLFGGGNVGKLIEGVTAVAKNKTDAQTIDNQTGANLGMAYLQSVERTNQIKAERQTEKQVIFGLFMFAFPAGVVWWAALLDGLPWFGHVIGSWRIAVPPDFKDVFLDIIKSFFIAAPATAAVGALARAFGKR